MLLNSMLKPSPCDPPHQVWTPGLFIDCKSVFRAGLGVSVGGGHWYQGKQNYCPARVCRSSWASLGFANDPMGLSCAHSCWCLLVCPSPIKAGWPQPPLSCTVFWGLLDVSSSHSWSSCGLWRSEVSGMLYLLISLRFICCCTILRAEMKAFP